MSAHLDIGRPGRIAIIEAAGTGEDIAAELTAAAAAIYAQLSQTDESVGAEFRAALTAMTREDAQIWTVAHTKIKGGYGQCVVYAPREGAEECHSE